ncbi:hypothetical protein SH1V18_03320 [Vallitalea longa]|uniref:Scaffolding protein n=1 Tax=Vallitalea longa TaxID=2936439 RepID=A0A9W5Y7H5_9FIRM|nr:hypothetical protein [Vallitalea longa]GKX27852.1 hypothetical protein SH1V18_03320 [Vallitalea longa]
MNKMDKPIRMNLQFFAEEEPTDPVDETIPGDSANPEGNPTDDKTEQEYDVITYNQEEVKIPVSERTNYLQKGYNYDKIQNKYEELKSDPRLSFVDKLAKNYGFNSTAEYIEAVNKQQEQDKLNELISKNIPEEYAKEMIENKKFRQQYEDQVKVTQEKEAREKEFGEFLNENPDIDPSTIKPDVWQLREEKGISLLDAYNRTRIKDLLEQQDSIKQQTEQETINKINNNAKTPGSASGGNVDHSSKWDSMSDEDFAKQVELAKQGLLT